MANIMTKRGQLDNVITYQHFCDTTADLANIEQKYCTLGSIAIVLQGDSGGLQIYIANSDKQWNPLTSGIGGGNSGGVANLPLEIINPSNGDILVYDASEEKWVNGSGCGGSGGVLVVHASDQYVLDKTWNEIRNAFISNGVVVSLDGTTYNAVVCVYGTPDPLPQYGLNAFDGSAQIPFIAYSPDDYPQISS